MIPTVDDIIRRHSDIFPGWCDWPTDGGVISIRTSVLRPCLEAAYDPTCPDWPQFVELPATDYDYSRIQRQVERRAIKARFLELIDSLATEQSDV